MTKTSKTIMICLIYISFIVFKYYKRDFDRKLNLSDHLSKVKEITLTSGISLEENNLNQNNERNNLSKKESTVLTKKNLNPIEDISPKESEVLLKHLEASLENFWSLDQNQVEYSLAIIDELIDRDPNVYFSYKAKLILLLTAQNTDSTSNNDMLIEETLTIMSGFDRSTHLEMIEDAFLITDNKDREKKKNETRLLNVFNDKMSDPADDYIFELGVLNKLNDLNLQEVDFNSKPRYHFNYFNLNTIEILLFNLLSKGHYQVVIEEAEKLIVLSPKSLSGHFFLLKSLELLGRSEEVVEYITRLELSKERLNKLKKRLEYSSLYDQNYY